MFDRDEYLAEVSATTALRRARIASDAETGIWTTKDGIKIHVNDMSDGHLMNTYRLLERNNIMDMLLPWMIVMKMNLKKGDLFNMTDLISRQAAINAILHYTIMIPGYMSNWGRKLTAAIKGDLMDEINAIPPAQPEIIKCKDCKWYGRADKRRFYRGMDCLQKRIDTIIPDEDFCSRAERKEDE